MLCARTHFHSWNSCLRSIRTSCVHSSAICVWATTAQLSSVVIIFIFLPTSVAHPLNLTAFLSFCLLHSHLSNPSPPDHHQHLDSTQGEPSYFLTLFLSTLIWSFTGVYLPDLYLYFSKSSFKWADDRLDGAGPQCDPIIRSQEFSSSKL